jgi:hypothetical protein
VLAQRVDQQQVVAAVDDGVDARRRPARETLVEPARIEDLVRAKPPQQWRIDGAGGRGAGADADARVVAGTRSATPSAPAVPAPTMNLRRVIISRAPAPLAAAAPTG